MIIVSRPPALLMYGGRAPMPPFEADGAQQAGKKYGIETVH